jgi:hypothetical protein
VGQAHDADNDKDGLEGDRRHASWVEPIPDVVLELRQGDGATQPVADQWQGHDRACQRPHHARVTAAHEQDAEAEVARKLVEL